MLETTLGDIRNWKSVLGNPYLKDLHPVMLLPGGLVETCLCRVTGMSKSAEKQLFSIRYDRSFVCRKIAKSVIAKIKPESLEQLQEIMKEAWDYYQNTDDITDDAEI